MWDSELVDQLAFCTFQVQHQQTLQDFFIGHIGEIVALALSLGHCNVYRLVRGVQPSGVLVVELGQGAVRVGADSHAQWNNLQHAVDPFDAAQRNTLTELVRI